MYVLDTNVISELRRLGQGRGDANVQRWVDLVEVSVTYITAITAFELHLGVQQMEHRDPVQGRALRGWLSGTLASFDRRIIPFDEPAAAIAAGLHIPDPKPDRDSMIAASALAHGFAVVTRNVKDFRFPKLAVINPWDS